MADKSRKKYRFGKIFKRAMALFIIVIINFNSYAAVVSSNDGSAFITKAEFDALVNDFNSRIEDYEKSIDAKIDGAIAEYLAGLATTFTETSRILIPNYNEMMWVRDYNMYGKWKKWTANTTYTQNDTNSWFTPSLNEKRHTFRAGSFQAYSTWSQAYSKVTTYYQMLFNGFNNGVAMANTTGWANQGISSSTGVPVMIFRIVKDNDGNEFVKDFFNVYTMGCYLLGVDKQLEDSNPSAWQWGFYTHRLNSMEVLDRGSSILKLKVTANLSSREPGRTATSGYFVDTWDTSNMRFPAAWCDDEHNGSNMNFSSQTQAYNTDTSISTSNYFNTGCMWHNLNDTNTQKNFLKKMMLGMDNSQQVNIGLQLSDGGERQEYDFSKSTSNGTLSGKIESVTILGRYYEASVDGQRETITNNNITLSVPHWPTENLKDLTTGYFLYQGHGLKYGEGFPIRVDNQGAGFMHITFDSAVKNIIGGAKTSNQNLRIDIKKENFLSTDNNYASGYLDLVDPTNTTKTKITFNNYQYNTTDGKIKITVPIDSGESLWIRLAPSDETKGIYAEWSNLNMLINAYS